MGCLLSRVGLFPEHLVLPRVVYEVGRGRPGRRGRWRRRGRRRRGKGEGLDDLTTVDHDSWMVLLATVVDHTRVVLLATVEHNSGLVLLASVVHDPWVVLPAVLLGVPARLELPEPVLVESLLSGVGWREGMDHHSGLDHEFCVVLVSTLVPFLSLDHFFSVVLLLCVEQRHQPVDHQRRLEPERIQRPRPDGGRQGKGLELLFFSRLVDHLLGLEHLQRLEQPQPLVHHQQVVREEGRGRRGRDRRRGRRGGRPRRERRDVGRAGREGDAAGAGTP